MTAATVVTDWLPSSVRAEIEHVLTLDLPHVVVLGRSGHDRALTIRAVTEELTDRERGDGHDVEVVALAGAQLTGDGIGRALALAESGARLVLAPAATAVGHGALSTIPPELLTDSSILRLRAWTGADVLEYLGLHGEEDPDPALVSDLMSVTGGHQIHLRHVVATTLARPDGDLLAPELWDGDVVRRTTHLSPDAAGLLEELSLGFRILSQPLAPALEDAESRDRLVEELDQQALLGPDGEVLPFVPGTVRHGISPHRLGRMSLTFLSRVRDPGPHAATIADLVAGGVRCRDLADLATTLGDTAVEGSPSDALRWYERAESAGASALDLAGRRAVAQIHLGDLEAAARSSDLVLDRDGAPDAEVGRAVRAALVSHVGRGLISQARQLALWSGRTPAAPATIDTLTVCRAAGDPGPDDEASPTVQEGAPTLERRAHDTALQGIRGSLTEAPSEAVAELVQAARVLPPDAPGDAPFPIPLLAGWAALHNGDPGTAEDLARSRTGQPAPQEVERLVLLGWSRLWQGDPVGADGAAEAASALLDPSQTRNRLLLGGLRAGTARRTGDQGAMLAAWRDSRACLGQVEPDLFLTVPLGELVLAAARIRESEVIEPLLLEAERLLERLDSPPLWSTPLHWACVQAAILTDRPSAAQPHARALVRAATAHPFAGVLATAGRVWIHVLGRNVDADEVRSAAAALAEVGQAFDGGRLAAHAAARCEDRRQGIDLLELARSLRGGTTTTTDAAATEVPGTIRLTERELDMVRLVLEGKTYREVGAALYLSARTVEHGIARIRRRSGATSRSELLEQLRLTIRHLDG